MSDHQPEHLAPGPPARGRAVVLAAAALAALTALVGAWLADRPHAVEAQAAARSSSVTTAVPARPPATVASTEQSTRSGAPPEAGPLGNGESVALAFVGDMNFEGSNRRRLDADPSSVLQAIAPVLQRADLAVGNLETALGTAGAPWPGKEYTFQAPASAIDALRAAGLDVVSMANNHGMDHGAAGLADSLPVKRAQPDGFVIGIGGDEAEAYAPFSAVVRGQRIAVIGATQVIGGSMTEAWTATSEHGGLASAKRVERLVQAVTEARAVADTVVVFLHWGVERDTCPSGDQRVLAATLAAAGADVIVGGHAHRVQGAGRLGGALVGYGLGNFLWEAQSAESSTSGVLQVTVTGRRIDGYTWVPARIEGGAPRLLTGEDGRGALARWEGLRSCTSLEP